MFAVTNSISKSNGQKSNRITAFPTDTYSWPKGSEISSSFSSSRTITRNVQISIQSTVINSLPHSPWELWNSALSGPTTAVVKLRVKWISPTRNATECLSRMRCFVDFWTSVNGKIWKVQLHRIGGRRYRMINVGFLWHLSERAELTVIHELLICCSFQFNIQIVI
jgi:hypothetical protein